MPAAPFGKWSLAAMALALAGVGAGWALGGGAMFSPGALHAGDSTVTVLGGVRSHAALGARCEACHPAPWSGATTARRCLDCHTDIQAERRDTSALHTRLADAGTCLACHTEHRGPRGELTRFDASGTAHDALGFSLLAHRETAQGARFACVDCHDAEGYRFDRERCASCHREYQPEFVTTHVAAWGDDCMACHDGKDRFSRGAFAHDALRFPLTGAHARTGCADCHTDARTLAGFRRAPSECVECHREDDEHQGSFGADCGACHTTASWEGATFEHEFPLDHGDEGRIACRTCHEDRTNWKSYTCYGCHEHAPARIRAKHAEEGIDDRELADCARCHPTGREHEGEGRERGRGRESGREREEHDH